jgi:hypothetical protein
MDKVMARISAMRVVVAILGGDVDHVIVPNSAVNVAPSVPRL